MFWRKRGPQFGIRAPSLITLVALFFLSACGGGSGGVTSNDGSAGTSPSPTPSSSYSLVVEVEGGGTVTSTPGGINCADTGGTCNAVYSNGTNVTLVAAPSEEYEFQGWVSSGDSCANGVTCSSSAPSGTSMTITSTAATSTTTTRTLRAIFYRKRYSLDVSVAGAGTVTSAPTGVSCGSDCAERYTSGTSVTLSAVPATGYAFTGWSGSGINCAGTGSCVVPMTAERSVVATFSPVAATTYVLQVALSGNGTVTSSPAGINCGADCSQSYASGTAVTLTATPATGYTFSGWNGGGCSGASTCTVSMTAATTTTATFTATTYALTVAVTGSGTVSSSPAGINCGTDCTETYTSGTSVTLTATPATGYTFSGWSGAGCTGTGACTVSMSAARSVSATFTATNTLTVSVSGSGTVSSTPSGISCGTDCSETYTSGTSVTLTATAASGSTFSGWSGACSGTGTCTVTMSAARSVTATFAANRTLSVTLTGSGTVTSAPSGINCGTDCSESYASGTSVTLTATPASGYTFGGWSGACAGTGACTVTMSAARSVTATFTATTSASLYQVAWDAVSDSRVTGYRVYYSTSPLSGVSAALSINVGNVTSYTFNPSVAGLAVGTTVYFGVTALGNGIESSLSDTVSVVLQ